MVCALGSPRVQAMTTDLSVSREVAASAEHVWDLISDITRMGEWSPEAEENVWLKGVSAPTVGAKFRGSNRHGKKTWKTVATITDADRGRRFSFVVKAGLLKVSKWTFDFEPTATGCRVTESWQDQRGIVVTTVGKLLTGVKDRSEHNRDTMKVTLDRLGAAAEAEDPTS